MDSDLQHPLLDARGKSYTTPGSHHKKLYFPNLYFYWKLAGIVFREGRKAKQGEYSGRDWVNASLQVVQHLEEAGVTIQIEGLHNIADFSGPGVYISNHMSTLETMVLPCIIQPEKDTTFIVKDSLMNFPYFQHVLRSRDPIVVHRSNPREDLITVLREGTSILESGRSIIIFPQRTRRRVFNPNEFNSLGIKLARRSNVPVVPTALVTDAWPNGRILKEVAPLQPHRKVHFAFGTPLPVAGKGDQEHEEVLKFIESRLLHWGRPDRVADD